MKITYNSPVVLSFVIISGLVLLVGKITGDLITESLFMTYPSSLMNPLTYIRMFTHVLGHASFSHYLNNMLMFVLLGPMLEEKYGSKRIIIVILATAFVTSFINNVFTGNGLLGASGVVFSFIVLASMTSFNEGEIPMTFILVMVFYLGQEVLNGLTSFDNISQMAHLIGGCCGAICGYAFKSKII